MCTEHHIHSVVDFPSLTLLLAIPAAMMLLAGGGRSLAPASDTGRLCDDSKFI